MFNQTLEDIKVLLEQILEELKFNNLSQKQKEEEWGWVFFLIPGFSPGFYQGFSFSVLLHKNI